MIKYTRRNMKKTIKVFYLTVLGILSFLPLFIMAILFFELSKIVNNLGANPASMQTMILNFDQMTKYHILASIILIVIAIYFIVYILRDKSIYLAPLWIISFFVPGISIISVPGFWFVIVNKELKANTSKVGDDKIGKSDSE